MRIEEQRAGIRRRLLARIVKGEENSKVLFDALFDCNQNKSKRD